MAQSTGSLQKCVILKENSILQDQVYLLQFSSKKSEKITGASSQYCLPVCKMTGRKNKKFSQKKIPNFQYFDIFLEFSQLEFSDKVNYW